MPRSVFAKALWERRTTSLFWLAGLAATGAMMVAVYPVVRDSPHLAEFLRRFPPAMMSLLGIDPTTFTTGVGFVQAQLYSFVAPLVLIGFAVTAGASATAGEEEQDTADLLLAHPIRRARVVLDAFLALALLAGALCAVLGACLLVGNATVDLRLAPRGVLGVNAGLWLLSVFFLALTMAVGAWSGKTRVAMGVAAGFALAAFFVEGLAPAVESLRPFRPFSPFYWYLLGDPARDGWTEGHVVLASGSAVLVAGAALLFRIRDLRTDAVAARSRNHAGAGRLEFLLRGVCGREIWQRRVTIWIWTGGVCAVAALTMAFYPVLMKGGPAQIEQILKLVPKEVFAAFGVADPASLLTPAGILTARIYASIGPVVYVAFAIAFATAPQPLDIVLATPISRSRFLLARAAALAILIAVQALGLLVTVAAGSRLLGFGFAPGALFATNAGLALLAMFFGALAMCVGRGAGAAVAIAALLFNALGAAIPPLSPLRLASPMYWYLADSPPLRRGFAPGMFATLAGTAALLALAVALFRRRDV